MAQRISLSSVAAVAILTLLSGTAPLEANDIVIPLGAVGHDMELDLARNQLYVSLPSLNEIAVISLVTGAIERRLRFGPETAEGVQLIVGTKPHGLDLSSDGTTLYAALNGASAVATIDLDTMAIDTIVIGAELGDARTWDVIEAVPNLVFASANPGSSGFAWITRIDRNDGDAASRVADNRIIRGAPGFAADPGGQFLYVSESFSPNSLYKLDVTIESAPIVLEDVHGSVSGTKHLEVSSAGDRIYLGSGQVLRTADFVQIGEIGSGIPRLNDAGSQAYVARADGTVQVYETQFFTPVGAIALPCSFASIEEFLLLDDGQGMLLLGDSQVCGVANLIPDMPVCEVAVDQATYSIGDTVSVQSLRVVNPGTEPLAVEVKTWYVVPGMGSFGHLNVGYDGSAVMPPGHDATFGPFPIFELVPGSPLGTYSYGCRFLSPVTGETLVQSDVSFEVQ